MATSPLFARSIEAWEAERARGSSTPNRDRGLMLLSVAVESDPVWGATVAAERIAAAFARTPNRRRLLMRLAAAALHERPPTGFLRHSVLHPSGERKGVFDIKHRGLQPIESLARWAGLASGVSAASTRARLEAAEAAGRVRLEPTPRCCATSTSCSARCAWSTRWSSCARARRPTT